MYGSTLISVDCFCLRHISCLFTAVLLSALSIIPFSILSFSSLYTPYYSLLTTFKYLDLLTTDQSAVLPPSSHSFDSTRSRSRSRPPTPSGPGEREVWPQDYLILNSGISKAPETEILDQLSASATNPMVSSQAGHSFLQKPLVRSISEGESSFRLDVSPTHSFARPPKVPPLPDPSQFPDPYPQRSPYSRMSDRLSSTLPSLSYEGSSSASTRSSAYTSSGSALASSDYSHVHVATGDDQEIGVAVEIISDDVVQVLQAKNSISSAGRTPIDQTRWSDYSASIRSRSSSIALNTTNNIHENGTPRLRQNPSFDMGWQTVDERDEVGLTTDEEIDDLGGEEEEEEIDDHEEERTSAAVVAEEGRGLIIKGESIPLIQLHVEPGECKGSP